MEDLSLRNSDLLDGLRHLHLVLLGLDFAIGCTLVLSTYLFDWGCFIGLLVDKGKNLCFGHNFLLKGE